MTTLTATEIQHIATETAKATVRETLLMMGVDVSKPEAVQKMQQDFAYLRDWREASGTIKARSIAVLVSIAVTGGAGALWVAMRGGAN